MATPALEPAPPSSKRFQNAKKRFQNAEVILISLLCLVLTIASPLYMSPRAAWLLVAASMLLFLLFLGRWISGRALGIFVNERNLMSLSRFQMVCWTVLLLSAFFVIAVERLHVLKSNPAALPLNVEMDWRIWALMGISATSLVGSPLLLNSKGTQAPDEKTIDKAAKALNEPPADIQNNSQGKLYSNPAIADAAITDMFQGDEVGDTAYVDVSKVQMFYFTVIAIMAYAYALYSAMSNVYTQERFTMPSPSDALLALLGISHAAYLTSKATQHG